jgi:hypothetical protein
MYEEILATARMASEVIARIARGRRLESTKRASAYVVTFALLAAGCLERRLEPLTPCLVANVVDEVDASRIDKVDLLFVVDDSISMREEQAALEREFPELIRVLTTGDRDNDGRQDFSPATDLHIGVVSTNLGVPGVNPPIDQCEGLGDDGMLNQEPSGAIAGCASEYPRFLSYRTGVSDPQQTASDFACIATLGTGGCGYEQQLEAGLKALWPSAQTDPEDGPFFLQDENGFGGLGQGDQANLGFIRGESDGLSIVAVVVVSDEEDCSVFSTEHLWPEHLLGADSPYKGQPPNLRCHLNPDKLQPVHRYVNGLRALRPGHEDLVLFAAIVGVPPDLVRPEALDLVDFRNATQRDQLYQTILDDERMRHVIVDGEQGPSTDLRPSCGLGAPPPPPGAPVIAHNGGKADPPRRIVEVARAFGENGLVQSICQDSFTPAMQAIIDLISVRLGPVCLPRRLVRNAQGLVGCKVIWELPPAQSAPAGTPTSCSERPFLSSVEPGEPALSEAGGQRCRVSQVAVQRSSTLTGMVLADPNTHGWFYDDFTPERLEQCRSGHPQRVAFTGEAGPPNGVLVTLDCFEERQSVAGGEDQPVMGDPCDHVERGGRELSGDAACESLLDQGLFCHPQLNVCVRGCGAATDCPSAFTCDDRTETVATTRSDARPNGSPYCTNPTCGE